MSTGREPIIEESVEEEHEPQPSTESAGGARPPGRIGGGLQDGDSNDEQPPGNPPPPGGLPNPELLGRWRDLPIADLNLSMRGCNTLRRSGIETLGSIIATPPKDLLSLRNFGGVKSLDEVREKIAGVLELGLWKTYRDCGLIYDWLEAAYDVIQRSDT